MRPGFLSRFPRFATHALLFGVGGATLIGCLPATFNVRAARAYSNEEANPTIVLDRTEDLIAVRADLEKILTATPYSPGDAWVKALVLDGAEADTLRAGVEAAPPYQGGDFEVPIVKLYRLHIERVAKQAEAPRLEPARYPSLLDAVAELAPGAAAIKLQWEVFDKAALARIAAAIAEQHLRDALAQRGIPTAPRAADPPALVAAAKTVAITERAEDLAKAALLASIDALTRADLQKPERALVARDALDTLSIALRVEMEALALLPTVVVQSAHAVQSAGRDLAPARAPGTSLEATLGLADLPARTEAIERRGREELPVLEKFTDTLAEKVGVERDKTAGFALRESIVDQIVGVQLDSITAHAKLDGEVMFFHQLGTNGTSGDYTGRTHRLEYSVKPVTMVGGRVIVAFDWLHMQNAASLNGGFNTDRLFSSNGSIQSSGSLGNQIGLKGFVSDVFDIGVGLLGVRTRLKNATFTAGEVREIGVSPSGQDTGVIGRAPLQLSYTQLDIGYDIAFLMPETAGKYWIEELLVGFRYMNYQLPRVLYELHDTAPASSDNQNFVFERESPAQKLSSKYFMGGGTFRFSQGEGRRVSLFGDIGLYGGAGPTSYYFLKDTSAPDAPANRSTQSPTALVFDVSAGLGAHIRLTPTKSRFRVLIEPQYHAEAVTQTIVSELRETQTQNGGSTLSVGKKVDFGGTDIFHGPRLQIVGVF
ncbi:MAG: hypothetical protein ABJE95_22080 [Byssovorax sp.]